MSGGSCVSAHLTSTELDDWSRRRDSEAHLPTLVRKLVLASVRPDWIRMPAAEGIALRGLDGVVRVSGGAPPYVPAGDSVWEFGTNAGPRGKATEDYAKRTTQTPAEHRARTTFVFVTSRRWGGGAEWVSDMKARHDGWKDIVALAADELTIWLGMCPGVEAWLGEHLGARSLGDIGIADWFASWSQESNPALPPGVLVAGRRGSVLRILNALDDGPRVVRIGAASVAEAVAFVAAALALGPGPDPLVDTGQETDADGEDRAGPPADGPDVRRPEKLEALRERTIVVEDVDGWRRWSVHSTPHILVPLFVPTTVDAAVDAGHHVVLAQRSRGAHDDDRLAPLDPHEGRVAWEGAGVSFYRAQEYALACRRNLGSVRRRLSRYGRQEPVWAQGTAASLLASVLLAGGWQSDRDGDQEVLLELSGHAPWRVLIRELTALAVLEDPPLGFIDDHWDFTDIVDAWDSLGRLITGDDLQAFTSRIEGVLTEADPEQGLSTQQRLKLMVDEKLPRRRFSTRLRRGMATTLAVLGAVVDDAAVAGQSGQSVATVVVRDLVRHAAEDRWLVLADVLELLAEAAPEPFLDAVEESLAASPPPVMALFEETDDGMAGPRSSHASLLWALEMLSFSPVHLSRVCVALARLAVLDPGGRQSNRPAASLNAVLHLGAPQGAVDADNRFAVVDAVVANVPEHAASLLTGLIKRSGPGIIRSGPQFRDWPAVRLHSTDAEYANSVGEICTRLLTVPAAGLPAVASVVDRFASGDQTRLLKMLEARWSELEAGGQQQAVAALTAIGDRHRQHSDAVWAMSDQDLAAVDGFLAERGVDLAGRDDVELFGWSSYGDERRRRGVSGEVRRPLEERRRDAVAALLPEGSDAIIRFAGLVQLPGLVGQVLSEVTDGFDEVVLDLLQPGVAADGPALAMATGLARCRSADLVWLTRQVRAHPGQAGRLLLCADISAEVLNLVDTLSRDAQDLYWSTVSPYNIPSEALDRLCDGLIAAGRPFTAIAAVSANDAADPSTDLIIRVLSAPTAGGPANPLDEVDTTLGYLVAQLLDHLEAAGVSDAQIGGLEFFYLPALAAHDREPRALHRELARDPALFAFVASRAFRLDEEPDLDPSAVEVGTVNERDMDNETTRESLLADEDYRYSEACWRLLYDWHDPLPGGDFGRAPTAEDLQAWVSLARTELASRRLTRVTSMIIGTVLAAKTTDPDGTWPCLAVRAVLEHEQDRDLEEALVASRMSQRGITSRGVFSGGAQERVLAAAYRGWAVSVRDRWPRAGAVLEMLAAGYEADGRREDRAAERHARE